MKRTFLVVLEWEAGTEQWVAYVPALNDTATSGDTKQEALENAKEAIQAYLGGMKHLIAPLPPQEPRKERARLILADMSRKATTQVHDLVVEILKANGIEAQRAHAVSDTLSRGKWTHDYPIFLDEAKALGLPLRGGLPEDVYKLMELYPQQSQRRPSVEYIPMPYRREPSSGDRS